MSALMRDVSCITHMSKPVLVPQVAQVQLAALEARVTQEAQVTQVRCYLQLNHHLSLSDCESLMPTVAVIWHIAFGFIVSMVLSS